MVLRLPVTSTTLVSSRPVTPTKLTLDALKELVTIAEECEAINVLSSQSDLGTSSQGTARPDQPRTLFDPTGGPL
jgi:hypothetical protein